MLNGGVVLSPLVEHTDLRAIRQKEHLVPPLRIAVGDSVANFVFDGDLLGVVLLPDRRITARPVEEVLHDPFDVARDVVVLASTENELGVEVRGEGDGNGLVLAHA